MKQILCFFHLFIYSGSILMFLENGVQYLKNHSDFFSDYNYPLLYEIFSVNLKMLCILFTRLLIYGTSFTLSPFSKSIIISIGTLGLFLCLHFFSKLQRHVLEYWMWIFMNLRLCSLHFQVPYNNVSHCALYTGEAQNVLYMNESFFHNITIITIL